MRDFTDSGHENETPGNPFLEDVFINHPDHLPGVARVHHTAFSRIVDSVESMIVHPGKGFGADLLGRTVLVTAPTAGYGKSHLSARLRQHLRSVAITLSLPLDPSRPVAWPVGFSSILRQFCNEAGTHSGSNSQFEETGRYLLAQVVLNHLTRGNLNPKDCPADEARLRSEFVEIFSSESSPKMLSWIDKRARDLCQDASREFLSRLGLSKNELGFWTRLIIDFTLRGDNALEPLRGLSNGEARERLLQWLRIATFYRPVLIVADGLDGFFRSETAGMEIAGLLTGIRESVPRSITVVSMNEDVWDSVFENRLPSAWIDRITGQLEKLRPIEQESAAELVQLRLEKTGMSKAGIAQFVSRLESDHLWIDSETRLFPRMVLRQASELWESDARSFFAAHDSEENLIEEIAETPLSELTDKVEFFNALQEDRLEPSAGFTAAPPRQSDTDDPAPSMPPLQPTPENPFFQSATEPDSAPPAPAPEHLAGIDSIIADIRGTGKTVVSETSAPDPSSTPPRPPIEKPSQAAFQAGDIHVKPLDQRESSPADRPHDTAPVSPSTAPIAPAPTSVVSTRASVDVDQRLREEEAALTAGPALQLDLERIEAFICAMGRNHPGLSQREERYPGSRSVCLRWNVHGQSILLGFESPKNVYFWNNLLQQSLASSQAEKIAAFSHESDPFDPRLFSSFGFSPGVIKDRIDVIRMNDRELAKIYAADNVLSEISESPEAEQAVQKITRHLDPLWRRISRPAS
jgi:hypothetical protein